MLEKTLFFFFGRYTNLPLGGSSHFFTIYNYKANCFPTVFLIVLIQYFEKPVHKNEKVKKKQKISFLSDKREFFFWYFRRRKLEQK